MYYNMLESDMKNIIWGELEVKNKVNKKLRIREVLI